MAQVVRKNPKSENTTASRESTPTKTSEKKPAPGTSSAEHPKSEPKLKKRKEKLQEESPFKARKPERVLGKQGLRRLQEIRHKLMTQQPDPAAWAKWSAVNKPPKRVVVTATTMLKYFPSELHTIDPEQACRFIQGMSEDRVEPLSKEEAYQVLDVMVAKGSIFQSMVSIRCAQRIFDIVIEEGRERTLDRMHARLTEFLSAESATIGVFRDVVHADAFLSTLVAVVSKFDTQILESDSADVRRTKKVRIAEEIEQLQFVLSGLGRRVKLTEPTLRGRKTAEERQEKRRLTKSMETDSPTANAWANLNSKKEKRKSMQFTRPEPANQAPDRAKSNELVPTSPNAPSGKAHRLALSSDSAVQSLFSDARQAIVISNTGQSVSVPSNTSGDPTTLSPKKSPTVPQPTPKEPLASPRGDSKKGSGEKMQSPSPGKVPSSATHRVDSTASAKPQGQGINDSTPQGELLALLNDSTQASYFVSEFGQTAIGALRQVVVQQDDGTAPNYEVKIRKAKLEPKQKEALQAAYKKLAADRGFESNSTVRKELLDTLRAIGRDLKRMESARN